MCIPSISACIVRCAYSTQSIYLQYELSLRVKVKAYNNMFSEMLATILYTMYYVEVCNSFGNSSHLGNCNSK